MVYYNINTLELLVCVTENCEQNFLGGGGGVQVSHLLAVLGSRAEIFQRVSKEIGNSEIMILEF